MYNDIWGCGTWAVVDHYLEKKPAYYAMKRVFAPLHLCFTQRGEGCFIHLLNDTGGEVRGSVCCMAKKADGTILSRIEAPLAAKSDGSACAQIALGEADYYSAEFTGENGERLKTLFYPQPGGCRPFAKRPHTKSPLAKGRAVPCGCGQRFCQSRIFRSSAERVAVLFG